MNNILVKEEINLQQRPTNIKNFYLSNIGYAVIVE